MFAKLADLDRRYIFLLIALALAVPLVGGLVVPPARMQSADMAFEAVEALTVEPGEFVFVGMDWGPNTIAENGAQTSVFVEHLLRRRIPFVLYSAYPFSEALLRSVPNDAVERLRRELPGQEWRYGTDWVNLGYRPSTMFLFQSLPKSKDLRTLFAVDASGAPLQDLPMFRSRVVSIRDIKLVAQFSGIVGLFDLYLQFFQSSEYRPAIIHGCTSITIPEAYIYLDSGQIVGLFEGVAGAAWYSSRLKAIYAEREPDGALLINSGLGIAQLLMIILVVAGNIARQLALRGVRA